jgi:hypothetical protein
LAPSAQQTSNLGDYLSHMPVLARRKDTQILAQPQVETQFGQFHIRLG